MNIVPIAAYVFIKNIYLLENENQNLDEDDKVLVNMCGTPDYTAPEMIKKEKYGLSVDVW